MTTLIIILIIIFIIWTFIRWQLKQPIIGKECDENGVPTGKKIKLTFKDGKWRAEDVDDDLT